MAQHGMTTRRGCFNLEGVAPSRRFETWRESIACIFDVERRRNERPGDPFSASLESRTLGPVMLAHTRTSALNWRRSPVTIARDGMDHYMIQFYARGGQSCAWSGGEVEMPDGGFLVYDLSREMSAEATDMANVSLILPRPLLADLLKSPDDQHMRAVPAASALTGLLRNHLDLLWRQPAGLNECQALRLATSTAQLVAACLEGEDAHPSPRRDAVDAARLTVIRHDIAARLADDLGPAALCRRHNLSRTSLYRLFEPVGGVRSYVREQRLNAALRKLLDPGAANLGVSAIGRMCGFHDVAGFSRAFQRRFGMSPRAARHYGRPAAAEWVQPGLDRRYEGWLHTLAA